LRLLSCPLATGKGPYDKHEKKSREDNEYNSNNISFLGHSSLFSLPFQPLLTTKQSPHKNGYFNFLKVYRYRSGCVWLRCENGLPWWGTV
jgi:hypothetical protein